MLAYERVGSGEPLVLLHGIGHHRKAWYPVLDRLAAERELFLVDLPGHGESDPLVTNGRSPAQAVKAELLKFFDEQGLERPHIAGNSIGGRFALELAAEGRAQSVTGLSPGGFWYSHLDFMYQCGLFGTVMATAAVLSPFAAKLANTRAGRAFMFFWIHAHPTTLTPERALEDFRALRRASWTVLRFITEGAPFRAEIPTDVPVTIAWADWDMVLPRYQARVARKRYPNAVHLRLPRCGHVSMHDEPERIAELILKGSQS